MSFLCPSSGRGKPDAIILIPGNPSPVRVERERDGGGWLVIRRNHGGDLVTALSDARELAGQRSSAGRVAR